MDARRELGEPVPEFSLPDFNGEEHSFSDMDGKVVIVIFWGSDGEALYLNGDLDPDARAKRGKREFSILRFEPFAEAGARLTALQAGRSMLTMGAFGPGKLSVTDRKERRKGAKGGVLDGKTDTVRELNPALLLLDRRGDAGLFIRLLTEDLATAKLVWQ